MLTCEALFLPVVPPVLVLVLSALVLPQLELGRHEECRRDHKYQLVEPELHPKLRVLPHPLLGSRWQLRSLGPILVNNHLCPR
jgi:hypothetical protein